MAIVHSLNQKPFDVISAKVTPEPLRQALKIIFKEIRQEGAWLVGGTALAGYYAEHRRSDDLDLFAKNELLFKSLCLTTQTLTKAGARLQNVMHTGNYFHALVHFLGHEFTLDIVLDENLHHIGHAHFTRDGVWVADLNTLFAMKTATLISRASEKDLFDLGWLFEQTGEIKIQDLIETGRQLDMGIGAESLLISLQGNILRQEACHFLLKESKVTPQQVFKTITDLKKRLIASLLESEKKSPESEEVILLKQALQVTRKLK